jgi:hypothetical protein
MTDIVEYPEWVMLRDTMLHDDMGGLGQRIYTSAGSGYTKQKYIRADVVEALRQQLADTEGLRVCADHDANELAKQLAEANDQVNQLNNMMRDQGFGQGEIDMMGWYEYQLAECQTALKLAEEGLTVAYMSGFHDGKKKGGCEVLLEAAEWFECTQEHLLHNVFSIGFIKTNLCRMAKELE